MADITATDINTQLGIAVFEDNAGAGPLKINLSLLTTDTLTLSSGVAEALFKIIKAVSETAAAKNENTDTYPAITRTIQSVAGVSRARYSGVINVTAPLDYNTITPLSEQLT